MRTRALISFAAMAFFTFPAVPVHLAAQDNQKHHHYHYQLIDLGTFGGPQSWLLGGFELGGGAILNNGGAVVGAADTPIGKGSESAQGGTSVSIPPVASGVDLMK